MYTRFVKVKTFLYINFYYWICLTYRRYKNLVTTMHPINIGQVQDRNYIKFIVYVNISDTKCN